MVLSLRVAAVVTLLKGLGLLFAQPFTVGALAHEAAGRALANTAGSVFLVFAWIFWRASFAPRRERTALYAGIAVSGLGAAFGTYHVLYVLDGHVAVLALIDMVAMLALFVGFVNTLPATLRPERRRPPGDGSKGSRVPGSEGRENP